MTTTTTSGLDLSARGNAIRRPEIRSNRADFEVREVANGTGGTTLEFNGYACVTNTAYEMHDMFGPYDEVIDSGAFTKTLSEGADVAFLVNHEGMTLARTKSGTLKLSEDATGLHSLATLDATAPGVLAIRSAIDRGDIDEMSFAFRCIRQDWSPDYLQRNIKELSLDKGDVSVVNYGANPFTSEPGMSLRNLAAMRSMRGIQRRQLLEAFQEVRAGAAISAASMELLQQVLDLVATADDAVDEAQVVLSDLMGVPNPDDDDTDNADGAGDDDSSNSTDGEAKGSNLSLYQARAKALALKQKRRAVV